MSTRIFSISALSLLLISPALATNGVQHFRPVVNESGILTLQGSSYGDSSTLGLGLMYNLAIDPAEVGASKGKLENYLHSFNLGVGSKISDRLHVFGDLSAHTISPIGDDLDLALGNDKDFVFGNIKVGVGVSLVDNSEGGLGFGIIPHVVAPVGSDNAYLEGPVKQDGKRAWQYGFTLAADYRAVHEDHLLVNLGWDRRYKFDFLNWGLGYQTPLKAGGRHYILFELRGEQSLEDPKLANSDPLEADLALKGYCKERRGSYIAGLGRGFNNEDGSPDLRAFVGIAWQLDHPSHGSTYEEPKPEAKEIEMSQPVVTQAPPPASQPPSQVEEKVVVGVSTLKVSKIYFANNKDEILEKSHASLDKLAADMRANPGLKKVSIEGYTDNVGDAAYNKDLSKRRAESVKRYLSDKGVDANRLSTEGFGPENPVADNATSAGRAANRRVEFRVLDVEGNIKMELNE